MTNQAFGAFGINNETRLGVENRLTALKLDTKIFSTILHMNRNQRHHTIYYHDGTATIVLQSCFFHIVKSETPY